jgi:hypothetical protein
MKTSYLLTIALVCAVDFTHQLPFKFTGTIENVVVELK